MHVGCKLSVSMLVKVYIGLNESIKNGLSRFLHPGVTDKGNYSMFEMVRPIPPPGGLPFYPPEAYRPHERPLVKIVNSFCFQLFNFSFNISNFHQLDSWSSNCTNEKR